MRRLATIYASRWYTYLISCNPWYRYGILLSMWSVLGAGWVYAVYYPLEREYSAYAHELSVSQQLCHSCSQTRTTCAALTSSINTLHTALKPYQQTDICPLVVCMELAHTAGLSVGSSSMAHPVINDQQKKERVTFEVSGTPHAYMAFLNLLAQLPHIIIYEQMQFEQKSGNQMTATCTLGFITII